MFEDDLAPTPKPGAAVRHTGFATREPMPGRCRAQPVLLALDAIGGRTDLVSDGDAALAPLTPFERGYVLGVLAEYRAWRAAHP
jgi:hypothetical protein